MSDYRFETLQLHVGQEQADPATDSRAVPIYQTTSYVFHNSKHAADRFGLADAGNIYGRLTNSTQDVLEKRIAALEGGTAALAVSSGAAAITYTIEALAANGGHIVAQKTIYGGSFNLLSHTLPQYGIETTFVDAHDLEELEGAIKENTKVEDNGYWILYVGYALLGLSVIGILYFIIATIAHRSAVKKAERLERRRSSSAYRSSAARMEERERYDEYEEEAPRRRTSRFADDDEGYSRRSSRSDTGEVYVPRRAAKR